KIGYPSAIDFAGIQPSAKGGLRQQGQFVGGITAVEIGGRILLREPEPLGGAYRVLTRDTLSQPIENEICGAIDYPAQGADISCLSNLPDLLEHGSSATDSGREKQLYVVLCGQATQFPAMVSHDHLVGRDHVLPRSQRGSNQLFSR